MIGSWIEKHGVCYVDNRADKFGAIEAMTKSGNGLSRNSELRYL